MDLSYDDVQNILKIIDASSLEELRLEIGDLTLVVRQRGARAEAAPETAPEATVAPPLAASTPREAAPAPGVAPRPGREQRAAEGEFELKAPMVGTFYRAPRPGAPPFVEVGSLVDPDDVVCIIEVVTLMNSITTGCRGRIGEVLAEKGELVEYGQPLMPVAPLGA
ncbi:MAG: acetyl-CoA carboxylase biotin carboxyl carrier protein [Candidatus Rokubacteria bacterium]|nr:acetyl-CoA carboxylase biotin carboxyl carrier protein [Candidatus Rokubacteria bacterium]